LKRVPQSVSDLANEGAPAQDGALRFAVTRGSSIAPYVQNTLLLSRKGDAAPMTDGNCRFSEGGIAGLSWATPGSARSLDCFTAAANPPLRPAPGRPFAVDWRALVRANLPSGNPAFVSTPPYEPPALRPSSRASWGAECRP